MTTQQICDRLEAQIDEYTTLNRTISQWGGIIYELDYAGHGEREYLTKAYAAVTPVMSVGQVRCEDWAEAELFLTLLLERYTSGRTIDPEVPTKIANAICLKGWREAVSACVEDADIKDLPIKEAKISSWIWEGIPYSDGELEQEHFLYTLEASDVYLGHPDDDLPAVEGCLLVQVYGDDAEQSVELGEKEERGHRSTFKEYWGVEGSSLEAFLALQLLCHNKNLSKEFPDYAYIRYQLVGGIWLRPIPEAITSFLSLRNSRYGCFSPSHNFSDQDENINRWLTKIEAAIADETDDETVELIRKTIKGYEE